MITYILFALTTGVLIGASRSVNGRLSLSTSALVASFWNHAVGTLVLVVIGLAGAGLWPETFANVPLWAWAGGTLGVIFVASGSFFVARIGAVLTAMMVIAGQMISSVLIDLASGAPGAAWARIGGVILILAGVLLAQRRRA